MTKEDKVLLEKRQKENAFIAELKDLLEKYGLEFAIKTHGQGFFGVGVEFGIQSKGSRELRSPVRQSMIIDVDYLQEILKDEEQYEKI